MSRQKKVNSKKNNGRGAQGASSKQIKHNFKQMELTLIRTYPKQVVWETWLPGTPSVHSTTVTSGIIADVFTTKISNIASFTTRFGSTFVEYRIIRAKFEVKPFSVTNPGILQCWIDEKSISAPTAAEASERAVLSISFSDPIKVHSLSWTAADPVDLAYNGIGTELNACTFKMYTNNATYGSSIVATQYFELVPHFQLQFRGLQGV